MQIGNKSEIGAFRGMVDSRVGMILTRWKDSRTLKIVSVVMKKGVEELTRRPGATLITVICQNDVIIYQDSIDGIDCGDQPIVTRVGVVSLVKSKK